MAIDEKALNAALKGPELKGVKIEGHEFNIKPASFRVNGDEVTVFMELDHTLKLRADDRLFCLFKKKGDKVTPNDPAKMIVQKVDGGAIQTILKLKEVGIVIGSVFGVNAGKFFDMLESGAGKVAFLDFDSGWEKAANDFLKEFANKLTVPAIPNTAGLQLFAAVYMKGNSKTIATGDDVERLTGMGFNDQASSLRATVPAGKKLQLFNASDFKGLVLELGPGNHSIQDLRIHNLNDVISSVKWDNA